MSVLWILIGFIAVQRLAELALARRNTRRLLARGGVESGAGHYPLFALLHGGWLTAMLLLIPRDTPADMILTGLFAVLQAARVWVIVTLSDRWTTRIVTLPNTPLISGGPYRWLRHPNYVVVAGEIAVVPLIFGAWEIALFFSLLNGALLAWRIRAENAALNPASTQAP